MEFTSLNSQHKVTQAQASQKKNSLHLDNPIIIMYSGGGCTLQQGRLFIAIYFYFMYFYFGSIRASRRRTRNASLREKRANRLTNPLCSKDEFITHSMLT